MLVAWILFVQSIHAMPVHQVFSTPQFRVQCLLFCMVPLVVMLSLRSFVFANLSLLGSTQGFAMQVRLD